MCCLVLFDGTRVGAQRVQKLLGAAYRGDDAAVEQLVAAGADVNVQDKRGWTALMSAALEGYSEVVEQLVAARADPNIRTTSGRTALRLAERKGHSRVVQLLQSAGAKYSPAERLEQMARKARTDSA